MKVATSCFFVFMGVACGFTPPQAFAQGYPDRPIRIVVPFSAGGGVDTLARMIAQRLNESWGQPGIVENGSSEIKTTPAPLAPAVPRLRKEYPHQSDDERLLRFMFAGNQVDEMHAAGPLQTEYVFRNKAQKLLEAALKSKKSRYVSVANGEVKLEAVRRQS